MVVTLSAFLLLALFPFQNCSDVGFSTVSSTGALSLSSPDGSLKLNNGALFTNNQTVTADIQTTILTDAQMALSNEPCDSIKSDDPSLLWGAFVGTRSWILSNSDGVKKVSLFLKAQDGKVSSCIQAQITLDTVAPTIKFNATPEKYTQEGSAHFELHGTDETSGVDMYMCRLDAADTFTKCTADLNLSALAEGSHVLAAYAVDLAGNKSDIIDYTWIIDMTPPTVAIVAPLPPATSIVNAVSIYFVGSDGAGSGIAKYVCYINDQLIANCVSPLLLQNLADGSYMFKVKAIDNVGLPSAYATANFVVDSKASGAFKLTGVSGGADMLIDNYLTDLSTPTISWSASTGAQSYRVQILTEDKSAAVCAAANINAPTLYAAYTKANCPLVDGSKYWARVSAFRNTIETKAEDFAFLADATGPVITIIKVTQDDEKKTAHIDFTVTDSGSGVKSATCYKKYGTDTKEQDCTAITSVDYTGLLDGDHIFTITAVDKAGNTSTSTPTKFTIKAVVCNPFTPTTDAKCVKGLKANLFYASAEDRAAGNLAGMYGTVGKLIAGGVKSNSIIYLPMLDVPARSFTEGFSTTAGSALKDNANQLLVDWFALEITTYLKLGPNDEEGYYQLIDVSDDGSNIYVGAKNTDIKTTTLTKLVANDGLHSPKVGCPAKNAEVYLTKTDRLPLKIEYYQAPAHQIAMSLYWKKVPSSGSNLSAYCGDVSADWDYWRDPVNGHYQLLKNEGYKSPVEENYISD